MKPGILQAHAKLAQEAGVEDVKLPRTGDIVRLVPGPAAIIDEAPVGRIYRDGRLLVPEVDGPVRERRRLSMVGVIAIAFALDGRGELVGEPEAELDGVPLEAPDGQEMLDIVLDAVEGALSGIPPKRRKNIDLARKAVHSAVRTSIDRVWGKRPIVKVLIALV